MITATLTANLHGRFATWDQGTRVKVLAQDSGKAMIEREEPSRGPGRMMPLLDQMCGVPMDCLEVEGTTEGMENEPSQLPRPGTRSAGSQDSETTLNPGDTAGRG